MPVDTSAPLRDIVEEYRGKNADEMLNQLGDVPFFMTELKDEENPQIEALKALAYEGEPWEIAENFKNQGNDCFKHRKFHDAIEYYTKALAQPTEHREIRLACFGNRAQCNLELKNYRRCITDCCRCLDIDMENTKAWFRSAKAFLGLDKPDEAAVCCERGLELGPNEHLDSLLRQAHARQARLAELKQAEERRKEEKLTAERTLKLALGARNIRSKYTITNHDSTNPGDLHAKLESPLDASSTLIIPVLVLYPLSMESDILQEVDETVTISTILDQVLATPPPWADPREYNPASVDVYAQTESGGLAKIGGKTSLGKALGAASVVMVDSMARLYVVPRTEVAGWIKSWNKQAQAQLLRD